MRENDLKATLTGAVERRLSTVKGDPYLAQRIIRQEKGAQPIMKKKLSVSLAVTLILTLLTLSVAAALVNSNILHYLYTAGDESQIPQETLALLHTPEITVEGSHGTLTLNEWLYDGTCLYTTFTMANPTDETLMYTLDGVWLNDQRLVTFMSAMEGAASDGRVLGGTVDGTALPQSASTLQQYQQVYLYDESGAYQGMESMPEGEAVLKISLAVWKPMNAVELVDYNRYEGYDVTETKDHLTVDKNGLSDLSMFRPESARRMTYANQLSSEVYADVYKELNWAQVVDTIILETTINLNRDAIAYAMPKETVYQQQDLTLTITGFNLSYGGGEMTFDLQGDADAVKALLKDGVCLVDREHQRILNNGTRYRDDDLDKGFATVMLQLWSLTDVLPDQVYLVPVTAYIPELDPILPNYDPELEAPEGSIDGFTLDWDRAITIDLSVAQ